MDGKTRDNGPQTGAPQLDPYWDALQPMLTRQEWDAIRERDPDIAVALSEADYWLAANRLVQLGLRPATE